MPRYVVIGRSFMPGLESPLENYQTGQTVDANFGDITDELVAHGVLLPVKEQARVESKPQARAER